MNDDMIAYIVECMATNEGADDIQRIQTEHRVKLVQFWGIKEGSRVLEIGCGQGDTTGALAYAVGEEGLVHGIDIASSNYGCPITVGDAASYLKKSKLGKQIKMEFGIDILATDFNFSDDTFDYIVFSHCSWYLKSFDELEAILKKIRKWGKKLCFAEWDSRIQTIEQYPHLLAVLIQSQVECFKESSISNVRTLFTPKDVRRIVEKASWTITNEQSINSPNLQDAKWEIDMTLAKCKEEIRNLNNLPEKLRALIQTEAILLEEAQKNNNIKPMSTYVFIAE
jgi:ubiquinone/menaquinone biosynthesis C-methylase UbiE